MQASISLFLSSRCSLVVTKCSLSYKLSLFNSYLFDFDHVHALLTSGGTSCRRWQHSFFLWVVMMFFIMSSNGCKALSLNKLSTSFFLLLTFFLSFILARSQALSFLQAFIINKTRFVHWIWYKTLNKCVQIRK